MRVLLVEDDTNTAKSIELMLKAEGYIVDSTNLGEDGLESLPKHGGADGDSDVSVSLKCHSNILAWTSAAALDETGNTDAVIASVNQVALKLDFLFPAKRLQAFVERCLVVTAVKGRFSFVRHKPADRIGHLIHGDQVFAADRDRIEAEIARRHVD